MLNALNKTIELINTTYPEEFGPLYGKSKTELIKRVKDFYTTAEESVRLARQATKARTTCVVWGWAGIGDAIHDRLIVQHLRREHYITWLTTPLVAPLYQDDKLCQVLPTCSSPFRDPRQTWIYQGLCPLMDRVFEHYFGEYKRVHISHGVAQYWHKMWAEHGSPSYPELFLGGVHIKRDLAIKHQLTHRGKPTITLPERYVSIEGASITFGKLEIEPLLKMRARLNGMGIGCVHVGGKDDPPIPGCIDVRGMNLYDTFSIVKNGIGFIGRSSGSQSLMCFLPDMPLFQVDIPVLGDYAFCGYHNNAVRLESKDLATVVGNYFA